MMPMTVLLVSVAQLRSLSRVNGTFGANLAFIVKARLQLLRDIGASVSPFNAWLLAHGLETLNLRMDRHLHNAQELPLAWCA